VTVPAAVKPDRSNDDGFMNYLPLFFILGWEGFIKPGQVRRPAKKSMCSKLSGRKAQNRLLIPHLIFPAALKCDNNFENCNLLSDPSDFAATLWSDLHSK